MTAPAAPNNLFEYAQNSLGSAGARRVVTLQSTTDASNKLDVTVCGEFMRQWLPAQIMDPRERFEVVHGKSGKPILFSIGNTAKGKRFFVTLFNPGSRVGWTEFDLGAGLPAGYEPNSFAVSQGADGDICIVLATHSSANMQAKVYVTGAIDNDEKNFAWLDGRVRVTSKKAGAGSELELPEPSAPWSKWTERSPTDLAIVTDIVLAALRAGQAPVAFVAAQTRTGVGLDTWQLDTRPSLATDAAWKSFPLPENATEVLDLAVGTVEGCQGLYALYNTAGVTSLEFTTLPDEQGRTLSYSYTIPTGANPTSLAVVPGDPLVVKSKTPFCKGGGHASDDLYIGGDGAWLYPQSDTNTPAQPIANLAGFSLQKTIYLKRAASKNPWAIDDEWRGRALVVRGDVRRVTVWGICGTGKLRYFEGPGSEGPTNWTRPTLLDADAAQVAALWSGTLGANQVFTVSSDSKLSYRWQDPTTTLWRRGSIKLPHPGKAVQINAFTVQLTLRTRDGKPGLEVTPAAIPADYKAGDPPPKPKIVGPVVNVWASQWVYIYVNGHAHAVGPHTRAVLLPDPSAQVTVIVPTVGLNGPLIHVSLNGYEGGPGQQGIIDLSPSAKPLTKLESSKLSGFRSALGSTPHDDKAVEGAHVAAQHMVTSSRNTVVPDVATNAATLRPAGVSHPGKLGTFKTSQSWAVSRTDNILQVHTGKDAVKLEFEIAAAEVGVAGAVMAEFAEEVKEGKKDFAIALHALADIPGVRIIIKIADVAFELFSLEVALMMEAVDHILNAAGFDLAKLLEWLGILPDMKQVLRCKNILVNGVNQLFWLAKHEITTIEKIVDGAFKTIESKLASALHLPPELSSLPNGSNTYGNSNSREGTAIDGFMSEMSGFGEALGSIFDNPLAGFPGFHVKHSGMLEADHRHLRSPDKTVTQYIEDAVKDLIKDVITDLIGVSYDLLTGFADSLDQYLSGSISLSQFLADIEGVFLETMLKLVNTAVDQFLELIKKDLLPALHTWLTSPVDVPFLTGFYEALTKEQSFTLLDGLALLVSLPTVELYREAAGKYPFEDQDGGTFGLDTAQGAVFMQLLDGAPAGSAGTRDAPAAAGPPADTPGDEDQGADSSVSNGAKRYSEVGALLNGILVLCGAVVDSIGAVSNVLDVSGAGGAPAGTPGELDQEMLPPVRAGGALAGTQAAASGGAGPTPSFVSGKDTILAALGAGFSIGKWAFTCPVGDPGEVLTLRRWSWGLSFGIAINDFIYARVNAAGMSASKIAAKMMPIGVVKDGLDILLNLTQFILNTIANGIDLSDKHTSDEITTLAATIEQDVFLNGGKILLDAESIQHAVKADENEVGEVVGIVLAAAGMAGQFVGGVMVIGIAINAIQQNKVDHPR